MAQDRATPAQPRAQRRALVIHCHPDPASFTAAIRDVVLARLRHAGAEVRLCDLHAEGFDPVLAAAELAAYATIPNNRASVAEYVEDLLWCDTLIFIYPTWWYGLPAMLKGWMDRVLLPGVAFEMPQSTGAGIRPALGHIGRLGVFTTCGASRWWMLAMGAPGKRSLQRGLGALCARGLRHAFAAHYRMDHSTAESRARHLTRVAAMVDRLIA